MARLRSKKKDPNAPKTSMDFIHKRKIGSTSLCGKTGVHTTKKDCQVSCVLCKDRLTH